MKLRKGDTVKILIGKDKGKTGKVEKLYPVINKVSVEGINQFKRHFKSRVQDQKSEIIDITKPVAVANVVVVCPNCKKTTRIGYKEEKGVKVRICKKCGKGV
ncbi:MAG TPA: 50S ribosomal protein L24 [Patescibacteria group bacterium]|nr:50S ribosomal protein L24 [Patescibacteria group bacterium]